MTTCDILLKFLSTNFVSQLAQIFTDFWATFINHHFFVYIHFGQNLATFNPTSGHTDDNCTEGITFKVALMTSKTLFLFGTHRTESKSDPNRLSRFLIGREKKYCGGALKIFISLFRRAHHRPPQCMPFPGIQCVKVFHSKFVEKVFLTFHHFLFTPLFLFQVVPIVLPTFKGSL